MRTLIKNGRVVTAVDDYNADILIEDGTISMIGGGSGQVTWSTSGVVGNVTLTAVGPGGVTWDNGPSTWGPSGWARRPGLPRAPSGSSRLHVLPQRRGTRVKRHHD